MPGEDNRTILQKVRDGPVMTAASGALSHLQEVKATLVQDIRNISNSPGAAPLHAAWRGGLKDLQDAVITAFPDSAKAREEPGSIASPTPQLVTENMTGRGMNLEQDTIEQKDPEKARAIEMDR
jgi:hypothetical protein